jgi:hypothetical protein
MMASSLEAGRDRPQARSVRMERTSETLHAIIWKTHCYLKYLSDEHNTREPGAPGRLI